MAIEYMDNGSKKHKELRVKTHVITQEDEKTDSISDALELLLKNQKQNDDTLRKLVGGLTQVIQAVGGFRAMTRSPMNAQCVFNKKC